MAQGFEEVNRKITTQFKLLELIEKEIEQLITRNKKSEIEKHLQHLESKLEKFHKYKYSAQRTFLGGRWMENLEEWFSVMEENIARFDNVVDRLKSTISNVEKKEEAKAKHEENIIQEEMFRGRM